MKLDSNSVASRLNIRNPYPLATQDGNTPPNVNTQQPEPRMKIRNSAAMGSLANASDWRGWDATEIDMHLNNVKEIEIRRNVRWLLRLTALNNSTDAPLFIGGSQWS